MEIVWQQQPVAVNSSNSHNNLIDSPHFREHVVADPQSQILVFVFVFCIVGLQVLYYKQRASYIVAAATVMVNEYTRTNTELLLQLLRFRINSFPDFNQTIVVENISFVLYSDRISSNAVCPPYRTLHNSFASRSSVCVLLCTFYCQEARYVHSYCVCACG